MASAPPLEGITPSTQVGRLSGSHSDIGFQLTQFPGWEGRRWNRKVNESAKTVLLNKVSFAGVRWHAWLCTIQLREKVKKGLWEGIMNHHGIKKGGLEQLAQPFEAGTH